MTSDRPPESAPTPEARGASSGAPCAPRPLVEVRGLVKEYGDQVAVKGISFTVDEGAIFGFIGPNGAGKTTTIRVLATLLEPTAGQVLVDGLCVQNDVEEVRRVVGYMPDSFGVYDGLTVEEYLEFFAGAYRLRAAQRRRTIADVLELTELGPLRARMVASLSKGMRQRLCLAKTLIHNPKLLILDEPASALDPRARIELRVLLRELSAMGKTILISSHILAELSDLCTAVGIIEQGELVAQGSVADLRRARRHADLYRLELHEARADLEAMLEACSQVVDVQVDGKQAIFEYRGDPGRFWEVLAPLVSAGVPIVAVERQQGGLEDVFLELTRGGLQ